jgi:hypothetical protein
MNDPCPGDVLSDRFRLTHTLGAGGAATVFAAEDTLLGVQRAVKVLHGTGSQARRTQLRRRLRAEARAMAGLAHPNILAVHDVGSEGELDFVVMDLASGGSLARWLVQDGPLPPGLALSYMVQVLAALAAAHAAGIVHRDVKPQNILLDGRGRAMLADFGIALLAEDHGRTTRTGVAMGSLSYMAPEQRLDARSVGVAADLYAAGATLYNLLTDANPVDLFTVTPDDARMAGLPEPIATLILRATRHAPGQRFENAREMARALIDVLPEAGDAPYRAPGTERFPDPSTGLASPSYQPTSFPEGGERLPTLSPTTGGGVRDATRDAITFLGDDFELFAARVAAAKGIPHEPGRGSGLTLVADPAGETLVPSLAPSRERFGWALVVAGAVVLLLALLALPGIRDAAVTQAPPEGSGVQAADPAPVVQVDPAPDVEPDVEPVVQVERVQEAVAQPEHTPESASPAAAPEPTGPAGPPRGRWIIQQGSVPSGTLVLIGSNNALRGSITVGASVTPVAGSYRDGVLRLSEQLSIEESFGMPPGDYVIRVDGEGSAEGQFTSGTKTEPVIAQWRGPS